MFKHNLKVSIIFGMLMMFYEVVGSEDIRKQIPIDGSIHYIENVPDEKVDPKRAKCNGLQIKGLLYINTNRCL
jgi:tetrahydromethanopterin S-methyltransferase subunit A